MKTAKPTNHAKPGRPKATGPHPHSMTAKIIARRDKLADAGKEYDVWTVFTSMRGTVSRELVRRALASWPRK